MNRSSPSLFNRMLVLLILTGLLPLLTAGAVTIWLVSRHTLEDLQARHLAFAESVALEIRESLKRHESALAHMAARMLELESLRDSPYALPFLRNHLDALSLTDSIALDACLLLDREGHLIASFPPGPDLVKIDYSTNPEVARARETMQAVYSHVILPPGFKEPMVRVALSMGSTIALGFIPLGHLSGKLQDVEVPKGLSLVVTDNRGVAVSHRDHNLVAERYNLKDMPAISMALAGRVGPFDYKHGGKEWVGAVSRVPYVGWPVAVMEPSSKALGFLNDLRKALLTFLTLTVAMALSMAFLLTKKISDPIEGLIRAFRQLAGGNYCGKLPRPPFRELDELQCAFETMASEVKDRQEALKASQERYRLVVDNSQDAILVAQDRLLKFVNPKMVELLEFSEEEITSRPFTDFLHPEDREMVLDLHVRRLGGEKDLPTSYRFRVVNRFGETRWVEIRVLPVVWEGRPAALSFLTDITRRLESERALRESEERYRTLVENSPDGIYIAELPGGEIRFVNQAICEMFGYGQDEALGHSPWDVLAQDEVERALCLLRKASEGAAVPSTPFSFKAFKKDGTGLTVEVRFAKIHYQGRDAIQAMVRDVTEHELLQRQLQHSQRMQALGTLASGVAHEFNNILAAIQGFAQLLGFSIGPEGEDASYVQEIVLSCERAANLTHKMLTFARADASDRVLLKLNQVVEKAGGILSQTLPQSITVKTDLTGGLPFVMGDPTQLEQVLLNLALNARDAMPEGGILIIGTKVSELNGEFCRLYSYITPGVYVELYVQDEGTGISPEIRERIFEPFFTTKEPGRGTGLGLSVSYSIVKNHGGFIVAESPPQGKIKGSILRVFLPPFETQEDRYESEETLETELSQAGGERILVADDESRIRRILKEGLEKYGYRIETAEDGHKAVMSYLEALDEGRPFQAVIMDLGMPVRDGVWASKNILDADPGARIVIITGHTDEQAITPELAPKINAILKKPFDVTKILMILREILGPETSG